MGSFVSALGKIKAILSSLMGIAPILSLFGVAVPQAAVVGVPAMVALMNAAEDALGDGTGPLKKQAVTNGMVAFTETMKQVSTGGQKETWEQFTPELVGTAIDVIADVANTVSVATGGDVVFDVSELDPRALGRWGQ